MTEILPDGKYLICECGALPDGRSIHDGMGRITLLTGRYPDWLYDVAKGTHQHEFKAGFVVSA